MWVSQKSWVFFVVRGLDTVLMVESAFKHIETLIKHV